jgi:tetratricopeptide (TPR) repeat protein
MRARRCRDQQMRIALVIGAAALLAAGALRAQEPAQRASLDSVREPFGAMSDTSALIARERERIAVARTDRDNPFIHMELGYLAYRLGELTGARRRYQDAASEFQWAADLRPLWPYAWYNLGLAELGTGESQSIVLENIRQMLGQDFLAQAVRSFARALQADPGFASAVLDLANVALRQRVQPRLVVAQATLRQAAATEAGRVPRVQLMRGRIERRLGEFDSALVAFRAYLSSGGDSAIGHLELARTQAQFDRVDSTRAEYALSTAAPPSDSARSELRRDIRWIAGPDDLPAFDALPADSVGPWLRRFWAARDALEGRRAGERLTEQLRRWQYALVNFGLVSRHRNFDVSFAFSDTTQSDVDDRGVIYLRHGEPTERVAATGTASWLYRRTPPEQDLVLHFVAVGDVQDYRLVESLRQVCSPSGAAGPTRELAGTSDEDVRRPRRLFDEVPLVVSEQRQRESTCVLARAGMSDLYGRLARGGSDNQRLWAQERQAGREQVREAVHTDSYALRFESGLAPVMSWFAVADAAGQPELHVIFAVPATHLRPLDAEGASAYMLELRLEVYDSTHAPLASLDTLRVFRSPQRLGAGQYLTAQVALRVPPGRLLYTFVAREPHSRSGTVVASQPLHVPRFDGPFSASDVVLGREGSGLVWRRSEGEVPLNPLMRYPRDGAATLYYELYGLPQGAGVETRVRIGGRSRSLFRRIFGGGAGADLAYTTVTDAAGRSRVRQRLELRGLAPGRYVLEVQLTDPVSGHVVVRRSPFEIEGQRAP